jgi:predicted lysophospholipase L1 biosynthesis ABC-type transport system permease subunit
MVAGVSLRMTLVGVAIGLVGTVLAARSMASLLFGISSLDLFTLVSCSLALVVIALLASAIPARRAAAIDPMRALRTEWRDQRQRCPHSFRKPDACGRTAKPRYTRDHRYGAFCHQRVRG